MSLLIAASVLAVAAQATPGAVAPPPIEIVTPAPPPIRISRRGETEPPARLETYRVEVLVEGARLWAGDLTISDKVPASFNQSVRNAASRCRDQGEWRGASYGEETSLRLSLSLPRDYRNANADMETDRITADVRWQRALPDCGGGGQASVGFTRSVTVEPGASELISGDAGLSIRLTRLARSG